MIKVIILSLVISLLLSSPELFSQGTGLVFSSVMESEIKIDGNLNDASWQNAQVVSDFIQYEPVEGVKSDFRTEVRMLFGKDDLYFGAMLFDTKENIENNLGRRDEYNRADWFLVIDRFVQ